MEYPAAWPATTITSAPEYAAFRSYVAGRVPKEPMGAGEIEMVAQGPGVNLFMCRCALPHADPYLSAWTAVFVVLSSGHELYIRDAVPSDVLAVTVRRPRRIDHTFELSEGTVVVFNPHHIHWTNPMPMASRPLMFLGIDFQKLPTAEQIEAELMRAIRDMGEAGA